MHGGLLMKFRLLMLLAFLLVLPLAATQAADSVTVAVYDVGKGHLVANGDTLFQFERDSTTPKHYEFQISIENGQKWNGMSLGFRVFSSDGALWSWLPQTVHSYGTHKYVTVDSTSRSWPTTTVWDFGFLVTEQNIDSSATDSILLGGIANSGGLPTGSMQSMMSIHFRPKSTSASTQTITFDTAKVGPAGDWTYIDTLGASFVPGFGGGLTFYVGPKDMAADNAQPSVPYTFALKQNYPNPFNPATKIAYSVERKTDVNISIYNILGQKVNTLVNETKQPGIYSVDWPGTDQNGTQVASGIYFYKMTAGDFIQTRKMLLMR